VEVCDWLLKCIVDISNAWRTVGYLSSNTYVFSEFILYNFQVICGYYYVTHFVNFIFKPLSKNPGGFNRTSETIDATKGEFTAIWTCGCLLLFAQVELVDMHYGTETDPTYDAPLFEDHLYEIRECHRVSRGCFFLVTIFVYCNVYENEISKSCLSIYV
jgi:hypothetical protein